MKVVSCRKHDMQCPYFIAWSSWMSGGGGAIRPPVGPGQSPDGCAGD